MKTNNINNGKMKNIAYNVLKHKSFTLALFKILYFSMRYIFITAFCTQFLILLLHMKLQHINITFINIQEKLLETLILSILVVITLFIFSKKNSYSVHKYLVNNLEKTLDEIKNSSEEEFNNEVKSVLKIK